MNDLSSEAKALLELIPTSGRKVYSAAVGRQLGDGFRSARSELLKAGLIARDGRHMRRIKNGGDTAASKDVTLDAPVKGRSQLSEDAKLIFDRLPADGSTIGNIRLRSLVGLDNARYAAAKQELLNAGLARAGIGRGGTLRRGSSETAKVTGARHTVKRESELYEPFASWLRTTASGQSSEADFAEVKVTASPEGRPRKSGTWSRPDVTAVRVDRYELIPTIELEISSYEIKKAADGAKLPSLYEAAAHGRWAHRTSLVVERSADGAALPERFLEDAGRFGLGLYEMGRSSSGEFEVKEILEPRHQDPDSSMVQELLQTFLGSRGALRDRYMSAIGKR